MTTLRNADNPSNCAFLVYRAGAIAAENPCLQNWGQVFLLDAWSHDPQFVYVGSLYVSGWCVWVLIWGGGSER